MTVDATDSSSSTVRLIFLDDGETFGVLEGCTVVDVEPAAVESLELGASLDDLIGDGVATVIRTSLI